MKKPIYLDHHSTTPVDPRVFEEMLPCFKEKFGNPASQTHMLGFEADKLTEKARTRFAALIGCDPIEVIFTAGASEANNLVIKGVAAVYEQKGNHILTQATEHKSVLQPCKYLEKKGWKITVLPVQESGLIDLEGLRSSMKDSTILISVMAANNEIGSIQPIEKIGAIAKEKGVLFHVDAAQALGKFPIDVQKSGIDLLSCSAHKMYGPKGVGVLYIRKRVPRVRLEPLIHGGGQEERIRSGTLNVPGIVGMVCQGAEKRTNCPDVGTIRPF